MKVPNGVLAFLLALLAAGCAHSPAPVNSRRNPVFDQVMSLQGFDRVLLARAIFEETNLTRVANGAAPLQSLPALDEAADKQASYIALALAVGHSNMFPHEHDVIQRVVQAGLTPASLGENAIMQPARRPSDGPKSDYTYREYAAFLVEGWMNSPEHRETLLKHKFTSLGCAARLANGFGPRDERILATQVFFRPAEPVSVDPEATSMEWYLKHLALVGSAK